MKVRKIKRCFIDVETTGLNVETCGITQLSGLIDIDGEIVQDFDYLICPLPTDIIDDRALKAQGRTLQEVRKFELSMKVLQRFTSLLGKYVDKFDRFDKFFFYAYNAKFDFDFMHAWFKKMGDKYCNSYFWTPPIDIMTLAAEKMTVQRHTMKNFKLGTVAERLQIQREGQLHDAIVDINFARDIYYMLCGNSIAFDISGAEMQEDTDEQTQE